MLHSYFIQHSATTKLYFNTVLSKLKEFGNPPVQIKQKHLDNKDFSSARRNLPLIHCFLLMYRHYCAIPQLGRYKEDPIFPLEYYAGEISKHTINHLNHMYMKRLDDKKRVQANDIDALGLINNNDELRLLQQIAACCLDVIDNNNICHDCGGLYKKPINLSFW